MKFFTGRSKKGEAVDPSFKFLIGAIMVTIIFWPTIGFAGKATGLLTDQKHDVAQQNLDNLAFAIENLVEGNNDFSTDTILFKLPKQKYLLAGFDYKNNRLDFNNEDDSDTFTLKKPSSCHGEACLCLYKYDGVDSQLVRKCIPYDKNIIFSAKHGVDGSDDDKVVHYNIGGKSFMVGDLHRRTKEAGLPSVEYETLALWGYDDSLSFYVEKINLIEGKISIYVGLLPQDEQRKFSFQERFDPFVKEKYFDALGDNNNYIETNYGHLFSDPEQTIRGWKEQGYSEETGLNDLEKTFDLALPQLGFLQRSPDAQSRALQDELEDSLIKYLRVLITLDKAKENPRYKDGIKKYYAQFRKYFPNKGIPVDTANEIISGHYLDKADEDALLKGNQGLVQQRKEEGTLGIAVGLIGTNNKGAVQQLSGIVDDDQNDQITRGKALLYLLQVEEDALLSGNDLDIANLPAAFSSSVVELGSDKFKDLTTQDGFSYGNIAQFYQAEIDYVKGFGGKIDGKDVVGEEILEEGDLDNVKNALSSFQDAHKHFKQMDQSTLPLEFRGKVDSYVTEFGALIDKTRYRTGVLFYLQAIKRFIPSATEETTLQEIKNVLGTKTTEEDKLEMGMATVDLERAMTNFRIVAQSEEEFVKDPVIYLDELIVMKLNIEFFMDLLPIEVS
jgi:hypothetical protein